MEPLKIDPSTLPLPQALQSAAARGGLGSGDADRPQEFLSVIFN